MPFSIDHSLKQVSFEEALITCNERSFAMGKDLLVLDDVTPMIWKECPCSWAFCSLHSVRKAKRPLRSADKPAE